MFYFKIINKNGKVFKLDKKLILLISLLVVALFVISACQEEVTGRRVFIKEKTAPIDDGNGGGIIEKPKEISIVKPTQSLNDTNYTQPINYTNYTQPPTNYTNYTEPPTINYSNYTASNDTKLELIS